MKHWRLIYLLIPFTFAIFGLILWVNEAKAADMPEEGVLIYKSAPAEAETETAQLWTEYVEGEGDAPEWYKPDEPMAVEWVNPQSNAQQSDSVCYNASVCWDPDETLWGWDGHRMEWWELDLFARIFYLEFYGTSYECCEAGCDAMLNLWDREYDGETIYSMLSAVTENGKYVYSTYAWVWDWNYDQDGLDWCRELCYERFAEGPQWCAEYFRKGQYHDWGIYTPTPAYEVDGIYFSIGKGW